MIVRLVLTSRSVAGAATCWPITDCFRPCSFVLFFVCLNFSFVHAAGVRMLACGVRRVVVCSTQRVVYGPSECLVYCCVTTVPATDDTVPAGPREWRFFALL